MTEKPDSTEIDAALRRAAEKAMHGTREERSGRFDLKSNMPRVKSSMMTNVKYDDELQELDITFVGGKTYRYFDVPRYIYDALLEAESQGQFFNETIKDGYEFNNVPAAQRR